MNEFNIKNGFISNSNSRVLGTLTATTLNIQTLGSGISILNIGIDSSGNIVTGSTFNGGTVTGSTNFTNGLTANTISATTYNNLPTDVRVTGATYSNNTFTYTNNTGGTFNVLFNTMTGLTVNGNLIVTGGTQSLFSGSSSIEMVKIIQDGSGDAFVVEDVSNGDASHFVINASGNTAIGLTQPIGTDKLTVSGNTGIYGTVTATNFVGDGSGLTNVNANVPYGIINAIASGNYLI